MARLIRDLEERGLLRVFGDLLSATDKEALLWAIEQFHSSAPEEDAAAGGHIDLLGSGQPLTPTGLMYFAPQGSAETSRGAEDTSEATIIGGVETNKGSDDSQLIGLVTPVRPYARLRPPPLAAQLPSIISVTPQTNPQANAQEIRCTMQQVSEADERRQRAFDFVFRVRASLRRSPETYREFMAALAAFKNHPNEGEALHKRVRGLFSRSYPDLMAAYKQLIA